MSEAIRVGDPPIEIAVKRHARAKRLTLRITSAGPVMTMPLRCKLAEGERFAQKQLGWLETRIEKTPLPELVDFGSTIPFEGRDRQIAPTSARSISLDEDLILVPQRGRSPGPALAQWMKALARDRLAERSDHFSKLVGRKYARITLRDTRSRWGSCSAQGNLMYSWRLMMAPPDVLDYVAAHEVAHLKHLNHSRAFWDVVEAIFPGYVYQRRWLRENGGQIQRYKFVT